MGRRPVALGLVTVQLRLSCGAMVSVGAFETEQRPMNQFLTIAACALMIGMTLPASASTASDQTPASLTIPAQGGSSSGALLLARRGADDPAGHVRGAGKGRGGRHDG